MKVLVDGHGERLSLHLVEGDYNQFKEIMKDLAELVGQTVVLGEYKGLWMQKLHFFTLPPRGAMFTFQTTIPYFPCQWVVDLETFLPTLSQWLGAGNVPEFLFASVSVVTPVIEDVLENTCKVSLSPLPIKWLLPYPIPPLEIIDDVEQMLGGTIPMEETKDATGVLYRSLLRFEVKRLTLGFLVFASRVVIYHAFLRKNYFFEYASIPFAVESDSLLRKLRILTGSIGLSLEERSLAAGLLFNLSPITRLEDPRDFNIPVRKDYLEYCRVVGEQLLARLRK